MYVCLCVRLSVCHVGLSVCMFVCLSVFIYLSERVSDEGASCYL